MELHYRRPGVFHARSRRRSGYVGSFDANVYALNASTGTKLWSYLTGDYYLNGSPAVADGVVYVYSGPDLYALKASTGAKLWSFVNSYSGDSSPAVANGVVYGAAVYYVYALDAHTGAVLWTYPTGVGNSSPTVADGVMYLSSYAFGLTRGPGGRGPASQRPGLKTLHPDFNLKVSKPGATPLKGQLSGSKG